VAGLEVGAVVNDSPVDCQSRGKALPAGKEVPSSAPCPKSLENSGFSGFSFAFRNRFFVGRRIIEIVDFYIIQDYAKSEESVNSSLLGTHLRYGGYIITH